MSVFTIPLALRLPLLLFLVCATRVFASIGSKTSHRNLNSASSNDGNNHASWNVPKSIAPMHAAVVAQGPAMVEAVVVGRPSIDFGSMIQRGDTVELWMALCHPSRLIRSILLGWVTTEAWRQCGLFRRRSIRPKRQEGKRYKRVTSTRKTYKREIKGMVEEPMEEELFEQQYATSRRKQAKARKTSDSFQNLVPESQEKGSLLTKDHKENLLKDYEVKRRRRKAPKIGNNKRLFRFLRLTRKKKFMVASTLGYNFSPFLLTSLGGASAGWMGVLCIGAELIQWIDNKLKLDVLEDNDFLEWLIEPFRDSEVLKAILVGSFVGSMSL